MDHCSGESQKALNLLKTARGQMDGIIRMVESDGYCVDVSQQILAVLALLKKSNLTILRQHMQTCVRDAMETGGEAAKAKLQELDSIFASYLG